MRDLAGRTAVVTGGGGGIGRGIALALAEAGANVVVADVENESAERVAGEVESRGVAARAVRTDVMQRDSVDALAEVAFGAFGEVHVLCNNAGVTTFAALADASEEDWRWVLGVNLMGVVHGLLAFLPRMKRQPGWKHVVNTASIAGMHPLPALGPYTASKYAVVGLSETLRIEGASDQLSCSVLCPGNTRTGIVASARNRPPGLGGPSDRVHPAVQAQIERGMDPLAVGRLVRESIERDEAYVFTHPELRRPVEERFEAVLAAFDAAAARSASE